MEEDLSITRRSSRSLQCNYKSHGSVIVSPLQIVLGRGIRSLDGRQLGFLCFPDEPAEAAMAVRR